MNKILVYYVFEKSLELYEDNNRALCNILEHLCFTR